MKGKNKIMALRKVTELKEDEGIHCKSRQEAMIICGLMNDAGLKWRSGDDYDFQNTYWTMLSKHIIYYPADGNYASLTSALESGYTIYPASDFIEGVQEISIDDHMRNVVHQMD